MGFGNWRLTTDGAGTVRSDRVILGNESPSQIYDLCADGLVVAAGG